MACNYVRLELADMNRGIWEYDVMFDPEVDHKATKIRLVNKHFLTLGGKAKVYDTGARLWSSMKTENEVCNLSSVIIIYAIFVYVMSVRIF